MTGPATIIVCGQIRDADFAIAQAREITRLRGEGLAGPVVMSTWNGELDRYPEVHEAFTKLNTTFVEAPEPRILSPGHVFHQAISIRRALDECADDARVFRIRPDIGPLNDLADRVLDFRWMDEVEQRARPSFYSRPIWAHSGIFPWPLYINDICFAGMKQDLLRLVDVDLKQEALFSALAPEQFFHLGPLAKQHPVLETMARVQPPMSDPATNARIFAVLWRSPLWYRTLRAVAEHLTSNYAVGYAPAKEAWSEQRMAEFSGLSLTDLTRSDVPVPQMEWWHHLGAPVFHTNAWAHAALTGAFHHDEAMERLQAAGGPITKAELAVEGEALAADLAAVLPPENYSPKLPQRDGLQVRYRGGDRLENAGEDSERNHKLEGELVATRRSLDLANAELSALKREKGAGAAPKPRRRWLF